MDVEYLLVDCTLHVLSVTGERSQFLAVIDLAETVHDIGRADWSSA